LPNPNICPRQISILAKDIEIKMFSAVTLSAKLFANQNDVGQRSGALRQIQVMT
jgi:hypothetical protein